MFTRVNPPGSIDPRPVDGGEVIFYAAPQWRQSVFGPSAPWLDNKIHERVHVLVDPLPSEADCRPGPAPADAEAPAQSIVSNPDLDAAAPVVETVGGNPGLRIDVVAAIGAANCGGMHGQAPGVGMDGTEAGPVVVERKLRPVRAQAPKRSRSKPWRRPRSLTVSRS